MADFSLDKNSTAWDETAGTTTYDEGDDDDLVSNPTSTATWHDDGTDSGIKYSASGFYALPGVTVTGATENSSATVINLEDAWFGVADYNTYGTNWEYDVDTNTIFAYANVTVTGTVAGVTNQLTLDIDSGVTVSWQAAYFRLPD